MSRGHGVTAFVVLAIALAGCGEAGIELPFEPGWRRLTIEIENNSEQPAVLTIAHGPDAIVGRIAPNPVAPGVIADVTFDIPPGGRWSISLEVMTRVGKESRTIVAASDVPATFVGKVPFSIFIRRDGKVGIANPALPGWLGQRTPIPPPSTGLSDDERRVLDAPAEARV